MAARRGALSAIVVLAALAGCGGGDDSEEGNEGSKKGAQMTLTKQEVIEQGDKLCKEFRRKADLLDARLERATSTDEHADIVRELADGAEKTADGLAALRPPPEDAAVIDRYVSTGREQIVLVRRAADSLDNGDSAEAGTLIESGEAKGGELRGIAQTYGFKVCGSDPD